MANENVIQATFDGFYKTYTEPSWLIDHGMELSISGIDLPDEFECHFSNSCSVAAKRQIGENGVVTIPDEYFLSNAAQIFCWIYLHPTVDSGVTEYEIVIPLRQRPNVDPSEPTQEQQDIVDQAIAALNVAMAATSADAESASASAAAALASERAAAASEVNAAGSESAAAGSASAALTSQNSAAQSATAAANSASAASASASSAASYVDRAEQAADAAGASVTAAAESAGVASTKATEAANSATAASNSATTATTKAGEAATSATNAANSANTANSKAGEAAQSATNAAGSATAASGSASNANAAKLAAKAAQTAAETAQGKAEDAQAAAEDAVASVSGLTEQIEQNTADIAELVQSKAGVLVDTATGSIASFVPDATVPNVRGLTVNVEPAQDLHGYDSPWPAGGGENLLDWDKTTVGGTHYGMTFTKGTAEGTVVISGTLTTTSGAVAPISYADYSLSGKGYVFLTEHISGDSVIELNRTYGFRTENEKAIAVYLSGNVGQSYTETIRISVYATTQTSWTPYSNICPISGWDSVNVTRTGKNIINPSELVYSAGGNNVYYGLPLPHNTDFVFSTDSIITGLYVGYSDADEMPSILGAGWTNITYKYNTTSLGFNSGSHKWYRLMTYEINGVVRDRLYQLELGSTATAYTPYQGDNYQIQLGQTVYGGTVDVTSGVLTVDYVKKTITSVSLWGSSNPNGTPFYVIFSDTSHITGNIDAAVMKSNIFTYSRAGRANAPLYAYGGDDGGYSTQTFILPSTVTTKAEADAWFAANPTECIFRLATPVTYQLSAQEVSTIVGLNNIWADTGDVSVEFAADLKHYIDTKIAAAVAAMS